MASPSSPIAAISDNSATNSGLRVLILSQHFWPESFRINDVARDLSEAGCEVSILTGQPNYPGGLIFEGYRSYATTVEHYQDLRVFRVPLVPRGRGGALRLVSNYLSFIVSASTIGVWRLRHQKFDAILVYGTSPILQAIAAVWLAKLKRCALVTWIQDLWPQSLEATGYVKSPRALAAVAKVVSWIYARCDLLLVQSKAFEASVRQLSAETPIRYHPNPGEAGNALNCVGDSPTPPALLLDGAFNLVFAGNLGTAQSLDSVLDAAEHLRDLPDIRVWLIGSGQRSKWLEEEVERRGLTNVRLPGRFESSQMPAIFAQASALLVSLVNDSAMNLTIPSKLQSYLAAGRPIVAALNGEGARIVLEAGAGVSCAAGDGAALAVALRELQARTQAVRNAMGFAGRAYYQQHFAPQRLTQSLIAHLQLAIDARMAQLQ
ncbi:glycosyltransferase family 4 protein [Paucibacter sp. DJ2R-2]|uniref:glycosyltransferase family 4 protein n=1 Tax=Paucibacter sp. DJ2R-2 TaxID=2893558 RepID=UPI0021E44670|nr:glycosyltransferase family 4 protein [Paucibacter sp. DJ2R-2]MCV2423104.1 glycosyltransferase family 4 protein [Paucibacter sp. DJ4R-1]MCV2441000.1 glycosyltransferase family 4 protein [Paucibacter sp. DJ2R-2]